jgi:hypothetical protein
LAFIVLSTKKCCIFIFIFFSGNCILSKRSKTVLLTSKVPNVLNRCRIQPTHCL